MNPKKFFLNLPRTDRKLLFFVILGAIFLTSLPYLFGIIRAGNQFSFLGLYPPGNADTNAYISSIKQVTQGRVFLENLFTSEAQQGSIFHPLWLLLGWAAGLFRMSALLIFHLARVVMGVLFLLFLYFFLGIVFPDSRRRNIAYVLAVFSSGLGIFFSMGLNLAYPTDALTLLAPSDQWITESNTFLTLMHSPLFLLSQLMLLVLFWLFLREGRIRNFFLVGGLFLLFVLMHPYDTVTVAVLLPSFVIMRILRDPHFSLTALRRAVRRLVILALCALPPLAMFLVAARTEPAIGGWLKQNITLSPPPQSYIIGYGLLLFFAVPGFLAMRKTRDPAMLFVLTWVVVSSILLYLPFQFNRRMSNGFEIPLAILAAVGIDILWRKLSLSFPRTECSVVSRSPLSHGLCVLDFFSRH